MSDPAVSVLMAVFNGGPHLDASIRSIAGQTFTDWELVVVDDASTDGTREVVSVWSRRDPRIRLVENNTNKGQTPCLNQGLRECRGAWVARQDADDLSSPGRLAAQVDFVRAHPSTVLLGTAGRLIDEEGRKVGLLDVPSSAAGVAWTSMFLNPFLHTSVMFRRERVDGYDECFRIAQDYDLWVRLLNAGPAANLPQRLVSYRRSAASLSSAGRDLAMQEAEAVAVRQFVHLLGRPPTQEEAGLCRVFRCGLPGGSRDGWHSLRKRLAEEFARRHPGWADGPRSVEAAWRMRLAGSCGSFPAAVSEMIAALFSDPRFVAGWLRDRF